MWSSSLIQIKKVFWWLCLGTGQCLAVLAACRDPVPTHLCPFCPCHCGASAALGSSVLTAPGWAARRCSWGWSQAHPYVSLPVMGAVCSALGTGKCQHGGDSTRTGDRSMAPALCRQQEGACEAWRVYWRAGLGAAGAGDCVCSGDVFHIKAQHQRGWHGQTHVLCRSVRCCTAVQRCWEGAVRCDCSRVGLVSHRVCRSQEWWGLPMEQKAITGFWQP